MRILLFLYRFFFLEKPGEIMTDLTRQECSTPTDKVLGIRQARVSSCAGNCRSELRKFYVTTLGSLQNRRFTCRAALLHQTLALVSFCYSNHEHQSGRRASRLNIPTTRNMVKGPNGSFVQSQWCQPATSSITTLSNAQKTVSTVLLI
jgi:hypothetical protein